MIQLGNKEVVDIKLGEKQVLQVFKGTELVWPTKPIIGGFEAVDMGDAGIWASCNVGANSPEEFGDYYMWGSIKPNDIINGQYYDALHCPYFGHKYTNKYYNNRIYKLELEDDAAYVNMKDKWRTPTYSECVNLIMNCKIQIVSQNGVQGYLYTLKTDSSKKLFFPIAGAMKDASRFMSDTALYWTADSYTDNYAEQSYSIKNSSGIDSSRFLGFPIRAIYDKNITSASDIYVDVFIIVNLGISRITVQNGSNNYGTFSSNNKIKVKLGDTIQWYAVSEPNYKIDNSNNGTCIINNTGISISPTATYEPTQPDYIGVPVTINTGIESICVGFSAFDFSRGYFTSSGTCNLKLGEIVTISISPQSKYVVNEGDIQTLTVTNDSVISPTATYTGSSTPTTYTCYVTFNTGVSSITVSVNGTTKGTYYTDTSFTINKGDSVTWTATYSAGYTGSASGTATSSATGTVYIQPDATYTGGSVTPSPTYYSITVRCNMRNAGTATVSNGSQSYSSSSTTKSSAVSVESGNNYTISATPKTGYTFVRWDDFDTSDYRTLTASSDDSWTAYFEEETVDPDPGPTYYDLDITLDPNTYITVNGTKYTSSTTLNFESGTKITYSYGSDSDCYTASASGMSSGSYLNKNNSITISSSIKTYSYTISINEGIDYVTVNGTKYSTSKTLVANCGDHISWSATAKSGYTVDSPSSGSFYVYDNTNHIDPTATAPTTCKVTVIFDSGINYINVNGTNVYNSGDTLTYNIGTTISWSSMFKSGYVAASGCTGNATLDSATYRIYAISQKESTSFNYSSSIGWMGDGSDKRMTLRIDFRATKGTSSWNDSSSTVSTVPGTLSVTVPHFDFTVGGTKYNSKDVDWSYTQSNVVKDPDPQNQNKYYQHSWSNNVTSSGFTVTDTVTGPFDY